MMSEKLRYSENIAKYVREAEEAGVTRGAIFNAIQKFQDAPRSQTTFYKLYRQDMESVYVEVAKEIGGKVVKQAKAGDFKSQELFLTTKGGWTKTQNNVNVEVDEETDDSALELLLSKLSRGDSKEDDK